MSLTVILGSSDLVEKISYSFCRLIVIQWPKRSSNTFLHFLPKFLERLVLWYLLFIMGEEQVANNLTVEIIRCTLGPAGPLAVNSTSKEYPI
jgi:hypothetical protein